MSNRCNARRNATQPFSYDCKALPISLSAVFITNISLTCLKILLYIADISRMGTEFLLFSVAKEGETGLYPDCLVLFFSFLFPLLSPLFENAWESLKQGSTMTYSHFFSLPQQILSPSPSFSSSFPAPWILKCLPWLHPIILLGNILCHCWKKETLHSRIFNDIFAYQNENGDEKFWKYLNCYPR